MNTLDGLRIGVACCGLAAGAAIVFQAAATRRLGRRPPFAPAAASARRGVFYAFGPGLSPAAKESTRTHPGAYALGVAYHLGIFTAFGCLAWLLLMAASGRAPAAFPIGARGVLGVILAAGSVGGLGLLGRRAGSAMLRDLSSPDDYFSNLLTTAFIALAGLRLWLSGAEAALLVAAILLLGYAPVGKIRHCLFFFVSRYHLGRHFGRRGTFPLRH